MGDKIPSFLLTRSAPPVFEGRPEKVKWPFLEKGVHHVATLIKQAYVQWESSTGKGFFQGIDARIKVFFLLFFILIVSLKREISAEVAIGVFVFLLVWSSRLDLLRLYGKVFFLGFFFGFLVALPSALNAITPGEVILPLVRLSRSYHFWVYRIPADIGITRQGMEGVVMLTLRVMNSLSVSFLVLYSTPFHELIRALKILRAPDSFLLIVTLCYKYVFIFAKTVEDLHHAKKARIVGPLRAAEAREWIVGRIAFIFRKTRLRCEEVFKAMLGRGFSHTLRFYGPPKITRGDWHTAILLGVAGIAFLLL